MHSLSNALLKKNKNKLNIIDCIAEQYFNTLTRFILCHNYIIFNIKLYEECIGLPQSWKASRMLSNFYLHYYEYYTAFNNFVFYRYIDDIIIYNLNNNNFAKIQILYSINLTVTENSIFFSFHRFLRLKNFY